MSVTMRDDEKIAQFFSGITAPEPTETKVEFTITIETDELDGGFVASCKELPGCMTQGETPAETIDNMMDALSAVLRVQYQASRRT